MKFIHSFNILQNDLQKTKSTRRFSINGTANAAFDLKVTNAAGKFYNFITQTFETNETVSTTSVVSADTKGRIVYINAANANIKLGMTVTGNGVSSVATVIEINSQTLVLSDDVDIAAGTTLTFAAEANLKSQKLNKSGSYTNNIVFPTVSSNDVYTILLEASVINDTELKTTEDIVYDTDSESDTYGEDITHEFTNKLFKSITINQYIDTTITVNASSPILDGLGVDYSANTFTIVKPRNFQDAQGFKTSFSWTFTTTSTSAIVESSAIADTYFETTKTQTVNGAVSSSRTIVLDSVDNVVPGMLATGSGLSAGDTVLNVNTVDKEITINNARSISDGVTITFTGKGVLGPRAYDSILSFSNLKTTLTPLTVTVATASSNSTTLALEDTAYIQDGSGTVIKGVGIDVNETPTTITTRQAPFTLTCAHNNDPTITHSADDRIVAGLAVSGTGIPSGATIASITSTTEFELSAATTGGNVAAGTLTFISNNITLSAAKTVEAGQVLSVEGSSSAITITGDVFLKSIGDTNFTSTLQIDDFVGIGVS
tara:strand:+ start:161 stop:1795 length:1635 start_codon:yes stop_codon:yes gene_type:complete